MLQKLESRFPALRKVGHRAAGRSYARHYAQRELGIKSFVERWRFSRDYDRYYVHFFGLAQIANKSSSHLSEESIVQGVTSVALEQAHYSYLNQGSKVRASIKLSSSVRRLNALNDLLPNPGLRKKNVKLLADQEAFLRELVDRGCFKTASWQTFCTYVLWFWYSFRGVIAAAVAIGAAAARRSIGG